MIALEAHVCGTWEKLNGGRQFLYQGHSYRVEFADAVQAAAFVSARQGTHAFGELEDEPVQPVIGPMPQGMADLLEVLYPHCEHSLGADLCYGPNHYPTAEQERAWGW